MTDKPLDVGNGIVAATVTPAGRWLSLAAAHPVHGRIELTTAPPFDEASRYDATAVRAYRAALASPDRPSAGVAPDEAPVRLVRDGRVLRAVFADGSEVRTVAPLGRHGVVQTVRGRAAQWRGTMRLARAAYTQLTEGGPLAAVPSCDVGVPGLVVARALGAAAAIAEVDGAIAVAIGDDADLVGREAEGLVRDADALVAAEAARTVGRRDVEWLLDCVASRTAADEHALLADPQILPLVWTRDAYWVARALLAAGPHDERVRAAVGGYLRWQLARAERPGGFWPRSSLANGAAKDGAFQLDQQLYPLLLLVEHAVLTGDDALLARHRADAEAHLERVLRRADRDGLVATSETPADDPLATPYHFSSHVLLWHTLRAFGRDAEPLRRAIRLRFTSEGRFAYAVGHGVRHYHDANDLPTALAPAWGFCDAEDPVWRATIDYGWSTQNEGYVAGPLGGLGSLHTRHPWPLGDLQRVIAARAAGDAAGERAAWDRIERVRTGDGLLPEAYDERDGGVSSRHWFAWPVALAAHLAVDPGFGAARPRRR